MKRILWSALTILCLASPALAAPLVLPEDEPLFIKFNNIELVDTTLNNSLVVPDGYNGTETQGNWGLVIISTIQYGDVATPNDLITPDDGVDNLFTNDPGDFQITGIFYDIQLTSENTATGGYLDLYWQEGTSLSISGSSPDDATVAAFTSGTFLARIAFTPGIMVKNDPASADCDTTIYTEAGVTAASGFADSYGNVDTSVSGAWTDVLDGDWFANPCPLPDGSFSDIRFKNSFNLIVEPGHAWFGDPANGIVGFSSQDPAQVFTAAVPEPTSLTLLALGFVGVARAFRRRKTA